jgi:molybdopterin-guanine dinucleotide biosynthesis protein A
MGGIIAALDRFKAPCLCISLDMPLLTRDVLVMLLWARKDRGEDRVMTTFHDPSTGYIESLVAIYEPEALPLLTTAAAAGIYKLSAAIPFERRQHIPFPMDAETLFTNINSPDELDRFRELDASPKQR